MAIGSRYSSLDPVQTPAKPQSFPSKTQELSFPGEREFRRPQFPSNPKRMASFISIFTAFLLLQVVHSEEYCAMYEVCGKRSTDGVVLNCPYGSPSVKPDKLFSARIQSLCPTLTGNVCCTELQFETLRLWVDPATRFLGGCPACLRNYLNLFCELSCSPNQSLYINVISVSKVSGNMTVAGIDYYISDTFGQGLYNSCKDVKFRSIDLVGAGAKSFEEWFDFLGKKASPAVPASPYAIDFQFPTGESSEMQFMNMSAYSCADTLLGCSCDDCPNACSSSEVMLLTIKLWPVEVTINVTRIVATFMAVLWDCSQLAWGMANLMGICSLWMVTVLWGIIWNFKFLLGLAIGYLYAHLHLLF